MLQNIWDSFLYVPFLNALAFLVSIIPGGDVGLAIILLTILVKMVLFPLSQKSVDNQVKMNLLAPELKKIKENGFSKEEQARQTFDLYKKHKTNPFSGCLLIIIQIPIIFALYYVFLKGLDFKPELLYSFVQMPTEVNMSFLGLIDISQKKVLILSLLAGFSQYLQAYFMPKQNIEKSSGSFQDNLNRSMQTQMKYIFPIIIVFIAYSLSGAVALYWITSNIFAIGQQIYANKKKMLNIN